MRIITALMVVVLALAGCQSNFKQLKSPPKLEVTVGEQTTEATIGTFCWDGKCEDKVGPVELLKNVKPIVVAPNAEIKLTQDEKYKPTTVDLTMIHNDKEKDLQFNGKTVTAPTEKGVYYYAYFGQWYEKDKQYRSADAQYAFAIKVE